MFLSGKTIMIDHGHGLTSIYIHLKDIFVKKHDHVLQGQRIGTVGISGRTTGPHLHWGITLFNIHLDPQIILSMKYNFLK